MNNNAPKQAQKVAWKSLLSNLTLALIKGISGILGNSFALIADAIESLTDVLASLALILGLRYAAKPPDKNHPYGHGKAEPLVTFLVSFFLIISGTLIIVQAIYNLNLDDQKVPETFTIYVLGMIILIKEIAYRYFKKQSKLLKSTALKAEAWHHRSDAMSSAVAFIGIGISLGLGPRFAMADELAAIAASFMIFYNAFLIFRPALGEVMDEQQYPDMDRLIRKTSSEIPQVKKVEKCHIRKFGFGFHLDLHIQVSAKLSVYEGHEIAHQVKNHLRIKFKEVLDVHIHIEPFNEHD